MGYFSFCSNIDVEPQNYIYLTSRDGISNNVLVISRTASLTLLRMPIPMTTSEDGRSWTMSALSIIMDWSMPWEERSLIINTLQKMYWKWLRTYTRSTREATLDSEFQRYLKRQKRLSTSSVLTYYVKTMVSVYKYNTKTNWHENLLCRLLRKVSIPG